MQRDHHRCQYCGTLATELDHVFPWSRGGLTWAANLVAACFDCNHSKGNRTPDEWRAAKAIAHYGRLVPKRRVRRKPLRTAVRIPGTRPTPPPPYAYLATLNRR